jgi:hypothetical protein
VLDVLFEDMIEVTDGLVGVEAEGEEERIGHLGAHEMGVKPRGSRRAPSCLSTGAGTS